METKDLHWIGWKQILGRHHQMQPTKRLCGRNGLHLQSSTMLPLETTGVTMLGGWLLPTFVPGQESLVAMQTVRSLGLNSVSIVDFDDTKSRGYLYIHFSTYTNNLFLFVQYRIIDWLVIFLMSCEHYKILNTLTCVRLSVLVFHHVSLGMHS